MPQDLVNKVGQLLKDFKFEAYWPNDPIDISSLKTQIRRPRQIEIDIVAKIGPVGFLVEVTTQEEKNERKINKFISKYRAVKESRLSPSELARLFSGIPTRKRTGFREVREWKAMYIGLSPEIVYKEMTPEKFSDSVGLSIINVDHWNYITALQKAIGSYARFEFMSFLGLDPERVEGIAEKIYFFEFQKTEGRKITKGPLRTDVYSFSASPNFLLRTCRVFRFAGLPLRDAKSYYQRMLDRSKLREIRKFIGRSPERCFPTPITVVLPPNIPPPQDKKIPIPFKYGSIAIIDGQHRVYAYASSKVPETTRERGKILVNGIKFHADNPKEIDSFSARTFIDINREQMKVKTSLIYLVSHKVIGEKTDVALAAEVISRCNRDENSPLHDLLEGYGIGRKSRLGFPRTSIVEVTNALAKIIGAIRMPGNPQTNVTQMIGNLPSPPWRTEQLISVCVKLLNRHFNKIGGEQGILRADWSPGTSSIIFKSKFMAAFILLLLDSINKGHDFATIKKRIKKIAINLKLTPEWRSSASEIDPTQHNQVFHKKRAAIPSVRFSSRKIFDGLQWYESHRRIWPELGG